MVRDGGKVHNAAPKVVLVKGMPHVCLFATRNIEVGMEVLIEYRRFLRQTATANSKTVTSTDGKFMLTRPTNEGKKPGIEKEVRQDLE